MSIKFRPSFLIVAALLLAFTTSGAAWGWSGPLYQMDMPTATVQPTTAAPLLQDTPTPSATSIFTGYTPYPQTTSAYNNPMGGYGMMGGGSGMGGGSMGSGGMGMGTGAMGTGGCSMMGGSGMSGSGMYGSSSMLGMDMTTMSGYVEDDSASVFSDPWLLIGWVLLGLLVVAILVGAGFGIAWLIRQSRRAQPI